MVRVVILRFFMAKITEVLYWVETAFHVSDTFTGFGFVDNNPNMTEGLRILLPELLPYHLPRQMPGGHISTPTLSF